VRSLWTRFRTRELLWGVAYGSLAAALFEAARKWLSTLWAAGSATTPISNPSSHAPIAVAMIAAFCLIFPRFCRKSACLFRSWRVGLIRGTTLVWGLAAFLYWAQRKHLLLFALAGTAFEAITDAWDPMRRKQKYTPQQIAEWIPRGAKSSISDIGFDKPIETWKDDAVGRQDFVETVLTRILVDGAPAIGISADFGEGKSSVLHLIQSSIERGGKAIAVPFRTWLPGSEDTFLESLFETATAGIREKYFLPSWRSVFKKYGRIVLGVVPKSWDFLSHLLPSDTQSGQIEELTQLFSHLPVRVVFLLDEIDRMHEEELAVLLKILRGAPELDNVSYVCAFSKDALARLISRDDLQFGYRYLDKFFPVQLQLPRIDADLRNRLFSARLSEMLESEKVFSSEDARKKFEGARDSIWYGALRDRLTNFRAMGQLLRGLHNSLHVLKSEVNVFDLLVIECIRMLLPSTYEFVYENGRYFHEPPGGIERWNRGQDFEIETGARKKAIAAALDDYFGKLDREDRELAQSLLSMIFPAVKEHCREKSKGLGPISISDSSEERRISDANFFSRYFEYAVPATMFGEKEMDNFVASIREADKGAIAAALAATLPGTEPDDLRRIHFLRRLRNRAAEIPGKQARLLAVAMAEQTVGMLSDHIAYIVLKGDVLALAAHFQGTPELQSTLAEIVQAAGSDMFASDIVYSSVSAREKVDEITNWSGFDAEAIKKVFGARMRSRHPKPVSNMLPSDADHPLAFSRWRVYVPEDVPYMTDYFRTAFDFSVQNLGTFLQWLLPGNVGYQGSPIKFVEGFYSPVSDIVARLKKAEQDGVKWSPEHAAAIQRFREFLDAEPESTPPTS
jgi:KAP family P-loop domain